MSKRQNWLLLKHIEKILDICRHRREEARYSVRVSMERIDLAEHRLNAFFQELGLAPLW